ncbi:MAG: helix-turn-helix domain-containing protein [Clostridia bacterium]|nr:helix-turn-helix domain-containing protein [Clostridia bacterium]
MATGKYHDWITDAGAQTIEAWAREGLTEEQIAGKIGIHSDTLNEWKHRFPVISEAIKKGKAPVDFQVENALLKRALGYDWDEITTEITENNQTRIKSVIRHVPPDVAACIFWLKNRRRDRWRDKAEPENRNNELLLSLYDLTIKAEKRTEE